MNVYAPKFLKNILNGQLGRKREDSVANPGGSAAGAVDNGKQKRDDFSIQGILMDFLDPTAGMDENQKSAYENRITQKLKSGKKLTSEEMDYIRVKNPQLYLQAARVQTMRENFKNQLENSTSKEAAENAYSSATGMIGKDDPMKEALVAAYDDVIKAFKKTEKYQSLPDTEEDAKKKKQGNQPIEPEKGNSIEDGCQNVTGEGRDLFQSDPNRTVGV